MSNSIAASMLLRVNLIQSIEQAEFRVDISCFTFQTFIKHRERLSHQVMDRDPRYDYGLVCCVLEYSSVVRADITLALMQQRSTLYILAKGVR